MRCRTEPRERGRLDAGRVQSSVTLRASLPISSSATAAWAGLMSFDILMSGVHFSEVSK
jgi:hypothetical protein